MDKTANLDVSFANVDQGIGHQLARPVVGREASTLTLGKIYPSRAEYLLVRQGKHLTAPNGDNSRVLEQGQALLFFSSLNGRAEPQLSISRGRIGLILAPPTPLHPANL